MGNYEKQWTDKAKQALVGRNIVAVEYLSQEETVGLGWSKRPIVLVLDDGDLLFPSMDDEGNNGGSLFTTKDDLPCIPTL